MKKHSGSNTHIMLALLAVLFISLGYLSMQRGGREGMRMKPVRKIPNQPPSTKHLKSK